MLTNYHPWQDYPVRGKWAEDLWWQHKLSHEVYAKYSAKCRKGHLGRKRELEAVLRDEADVRVDEEIALRKRQLSALLFPFKRIPEVVEWESQYLRVHPRYKLLVLHADTRAGKTTFAESLFENPCTVTVEDSVHLDLKDFDRSKNDGVVLECVMDAMQEVPQLIVWAVYPSCTPRRRRWRGSRGPRSTRWRGSRDS